ncbi:MAG: sporulation-like protein, partial [Cycloclasticus pugetii]
MPRDYKNRINSNNTRKKKRPIPGYWWLITGLLIGGFAMFLSDLEEAPNKPVTDVKRPVNQQDVRDV